MQGSVLMAQSADQPPSRQEALALEQKGVAAEAEQAWGDATSRVRTFQEDAEQYVRENPTKAVFTALGIGFVLGLIFRR